MKLNEKIKNYIIISLGALLLVSGIFNTCNYNGGSISDREITRGLQSVTNRIRQSIDILYSIKGSITELVRERDNNRIIIEQLRTEVDGTEQLYTELQNNYQRLREQQRQNIETIRNIIRASDGIGNSITGLGNGIDGIGDFIRAIQKPAEPAQD